MITKIHITFDITKSMFNELNSEFDLYILWHVENPIWNSSQTYILKDYLKRNQQTLFGTYLNKPLTKV